MAFLAPPQFKWPLSTRAAAVFREPSGGAGSRPSRINCSFSSTAVVDAECLSLGPPPSPQRTLSVTSVSTPSASALWLQISVRVGEDRQIFVNCSSPLDCLNQGCFGEALLNKEAVVAAAAAEAVALARAAAEVAGEVARMAQNDHPAALPPRDDTVDSFLSREVLRSEVGLDARRAGLEMLEGEEHSSIFSDESEDDDDGGHSIAVAVKSARRSERRARRVRAAMKTAKCSSSMKPVGASSTRRKRLKGCLTPLGCLYKMTGPRLLTAEQEVEFSEGIQVN